MKMRFYAYILLIVILAFLLSLNHLNYFSLEDLSLFLTVTGLLYGLISAFTVTNAWERFSSIRDAIAEETNSLIAAYLFSKKLSDKSSSRKLKAKLIEYCSEVPTIEWKDYWKREKTHKKFRELITIISGINFKNNKDVELFDEISEEIRDASAARNLQLVLSQARVPKIQWVLNIFLSLVLIIGMLLSYIPNTILSIFVTSTMIASIILILFVAYELDTMKVSEEEVSNEPYYQAVRIFKTE